MAGRALDPLEIPAGFWDRPGVLHALDSRDFGALFHLVRRYAAGSQTRIAVAIGATQPQVSTIMSPDPRKQRRVLELDLIERIATGLGMPDHARMRLGLAPRTPSARTPELPDPLTHELARSHPTAGLAFLPMLSNGSGAYLVIPPGRVLSGATIGLQMHPAARASVGSVAVTLGDPADIDAVFRSPHQTLLIGSEVGADTPGYFALSIRQARRQLAGNHSTPARVVIPRAHSLDGFSLAVIWAAASLDNGLLSDDAGLAESRRRLRGYDDLATSAVSRDVATDLATVSQMWVGSDFCARYIQRHLTEAPDRPRFWTREQRGEEACTWLLFRHKYEYLRRTSGHHLRKAPLTRAFCIPEDTVTASPMTERVLLLLAVALMESLGVRVLVCTEPDYGNVEGAVLVPGKRVIIANWVRSAGIWHVDTTGNRAVVRECADALGHASAHSAIDSPTPAGRLATLADYLSLDWPWLCQRASELAAVGCAGLLKPSSRHLSVDSIDAACRYLGTLESPPAEHAVL